MKKALRVRFWLETGTAITTGTLFMITLVSHNWIEIIFNFDPDQSSGLLEWSIVGTLLLATVTLIILACYEWRRALAIV